MEDKRERWREGGDGGKEGQMEDKREGGRGTEEEEEEEEKEKRGRKRKK
jgi:hypothetical protein